MRRHHGKKGANVDHLLAFEVARGEHVLSANSSERDIAAANREHQRHQPAANAHRHQRRNHSYHGGCGSGGPAAGGGGARIDAHQRTAAYFLLNFQFVIARDDVYLPQVKSVLTTRDDLPDWSVVKFVTFRCPLDEYKCPICLDTPIGAVVSTTCGHLFCLSCLYALVLHEAAGGSAAATTTTATAMAPSGSGPTPPTSPVPTTAGPNPLGLRHSGSNGLSPTGTGTSFPPLPTHHVKAGCPMCSRPLSLRSVVAAVHVPTSSAAAASSSCTKPRTFVRRVLPTASGGVPLAFCGAPDATFARVLVESDVTLAWATQQAFDLSDRVAEAQADVDLAAAHVMTVVQHEAERISADLRDRSSAAAVLRAASTAGGGGVDALIRSWNTPTPNSRAMGGTGGGPTSRVPAVVQQARDAHRSAAADLESLQRSQAWFSDLLTSCTTPAATAEMDLDSVQAMHLATSQMMSMESSTGGGEPTTAGDPSGAPAQPAWVYQSADGQPVFLHPLLVKMVVDSSLPTPPSPAPVSVRGSGENPPASGPFAAAVAAGDDDDLVDGSRQAAAAATASRLTAVLPPETVDVALDEVESVEQTHASRHQHKAFSYLPLGGSFSLVYSPRLAPCVSAAVRKKYAEPIEARRRKRQQRMRMEREEEQERSHRDRRRKEAMLSRAVPTTSNHPGVGSGSGPYGGSFGGGTGHSDPWAMIGSSAGSDQLGGVPGLSPDLTHNTPTLPPATPPSAAAAANSSAAMPVLHYHSGTGGSGGGDRQPTPKDDGVPVASSKASSPPKPCAWNRPGGKSILDTLDSPSLATLAEPSNNSPLPSTTAPAWGTRR